MKQTSGQECFPQGKWRRWKEGGGAGVWVEGVAMEKGGH